MFAKLHETDLGQILVKLDSSDEDGMTAEVRYFFEPEGLGVCSCAMQFKEFESAEEVFNKSTEDSAHPDCKSAYRAVYLRGDWW